MNLKEFDKVHDYSRHQQKFKILKVPDISRFSLTMGTLYLI